MNVQVSEWYVPSCGECLPIIENLVRSAIRDSTVTKLAISAGHQHCHPHDAQNPKSKPQQIAATGAATPSSSAAPASGVQAPSGVLFSESEVAGLMVNAAALPNGFDG